MATIYEVPLTAEPQRFTIALGGTTYRVDLLWRDPAPGWVIDIADSSGTPLVQGVPLVTGANLLEQYGHLGFTGGLHVQTDNDADAVPTLGNLGTTSHLYFATAS